MTYQLPPPPTAQTVRLRRWSLIGGGVAIVLAMLCAAFLPGGPALFFVATIGLMLIAGVLLMVAAFAPGVSDWWDKRHQPIQPGAGGWMP